ncbi:MAG: transcriptional repressor [Anaerolineales bacterium]|nr:transcriptional repressor [Anaerolineales bacterium]
MDKTLTSGRLPRHRPREAVISVLLSSLRPLGIQELHELARVQHPDLGLVTVYRTVEKLLELNLVQRIHRADGHHAYLSTSSSDQHMLFVQLVRTGRLL